MTAKLKLEDVHYHIDWQGWADAVAMDYDQTEFDGDNYYWRA